MDSLRSSLVDRSVTQDTNVARELKKNHILAEFCKNGQEDVDALYQRVGSMLIGDGLEEC